MHVSLQINYLFLSMNPSVMATLSTHSLSLYLNKMNQYLGYIQLLELNLSNTTITYICVSCLSRRICYAGIIPWTIRPWKYRNITVWFATGVPLTVTVAITVCVVPTGFDALDGLRITKPCPIDIVAVPRIMPLWTLSELLNLFYSYCSPLF